ncbi:MAG TPA: cysteine methyltransferase, partial [Vicinamibacteria bacterium]|nr:cysteine methyltransferase [Vicinamibacteria bacterium]
MTRIEETSVDSPVGRLRGYTRDGVLLLLEFEEGDRGLHAGVQRRFPDAVFEETRRPEFLAPLVRYFDGDLRALDRIACDPGGTPF